MFDHSEHIAWHAIPIAGIVAGIAFIVTSLILNPIYLGIEEPFFLVNYFGSILLGSEALVEPDILSLVTGFVVHTILSILFTMVIAIVIHRWGFVIGMVGGGLLGLAIYGINFYTMTLFFDWMFAINSWVLATSHVVFGVVAGGVYEIFDSYDINIVEEIEPA